MTYISSLNEYFHISCLVYIDDSTKEDTVLENEVHQNMSNINDIALTQQLSIAQIFM
jgi:hypothetical protein